MLGPGTTYIFGYWEADGAFGLTDRFHRECRDVFRSTRHRLWPRDAFREREARLRYRIHQGNVQFEDNVTQEHRRLRTRLLCYVRTARLTVILTTPVIYAGIVPFFLLDLFLTLYQALCFPIYGIPSVKRADYLLFDRGHLAYLNWLERLNCRYCSYANGLLAYAVDVAARTEQHWCPIKHASRVRLAHARYTHFLEYGNATQYHTSVDTVRSDFGDLAPTVGDKPTIPTVSE